MSMGPLTDALLPLVCPQAGVDLAASQGGGIDDSLAWLVGGFVEDGCELIPLVEFKS